MSAYSKTPLAKKLGIKEGAKIYIKNPPPEYSQLLEPLPPKLTFLKRLSQDIDFIHFFTRQRYELQKLLPAQLSSIKQNGVIWVSWPKKSSRLDTDITEDVIRDVALPLGLVDIKVCAVNET